MAELRTLLAAVLGVGLGLLCLGAPEAVVRAHTVGRVPDGRGGEYGADDVPGRWRRLVQAVGVALVVAGGYFATRAL